jgi:plastocyanin
VRRSAAALISLAVLGALLAASGVTRIDAGNRAEAAECTWHRHTKRVVKRVRRDGGVRRVARARHWWTCDQVSSPPAIAAPTTPPPAPAEPGPQPEPEPTSKTVGVTATEYQYTLSRTSVKPGAVTIELNNAGEDGHNLNLQRQGGGGEPVYAISETASRQRQTAHFELPEGTYRLWCSLPTHEAQGMVASLDVTPDAD